MKKNPPTPIQLRFLLLLWFYYFFLPLPWFSRGYAGVRVLFSDLSGKMMSLHQTSLGHSPLWQTHSLCCRQAGLKCRKDLSLSCCFSRLQNLLRISRQKSITCRKGSGSFLFASLFPFPKKYLPSLQAVVRVWTHMMIDLIWVCK